MDPDLPCGPDEWQGEGDDSKEYEGAVKERQHGDDVSEDGLDINCWGAKNKDGDNVPCKAKQTDNREQETLHKKACLGDHSLLSI